jgi:hypothetical protein
MRLRAVARKKDARELFARRQQWENDHVDVDVEESSEAIAGGAVTS